MCLPTFLSGYVLPVYFDKNKLAVRDLQVSFWSEAGISAGYKHEEGMKESLGINTLQTAE